MKPNFKNIDIYAGFQPQNGMEWQKENGITADWKLVIKKDKIFFYDMTPMEAELFSDNDNE